ncbi:hypothetical protein KGF57_005203 [Candida theae]|uniref:DUF3020 domain-containing protein n=1 Tax=Candida theae TaxID=1198502 RepID=A0AAD5FW66_9ASCO|nr:uncharacterized protein KGF57_005203 [Candida theae]KAI5948805.1 hypothetical protein KGF57_005203 [Candida theae]
MSERKQHSDKESEPNLRRYSDELESSIGAIFDDIDFNSILRQDDIQSKADVETGTRIPNKEMSKNSESYGDDDMKDAINNALNDVFDFKDKHAGHETLGDVDHAPESSRVPQMAQDTKGPNSDQNRDLGAPSAPKRHDLDDVIDSVFSDLLQGQPENIEEPLQANVSEKTDTPHKDGTTLMSEINSSIRTSALSTERNNKENARIEEEKDTKNGSPGRTELQDKKLEVEHKISHSLKQGNHDDADDDELNSAIRNALGNIFENETQDNSSDNKGVLEKAEKEKTERPVNHDEASSFIENRSVTTRNEPKISLPKNQPNDQEGVKNAPNVVAREDVPTLKKSRSQPLTDLTAVSDENLDENLKGIIGHAFDQVFGKQSSRDNNSYGEPRYTVENKAHQISVPDPTKSESHRGPAPRHELRYSAAEVIRPQVAQSGSPATHSSLVRSEEQDHDQYLVEAIGAAFRSIEEQATPSKHSRGLQSGAGTRDDASNSIVEGKSSGNMNTPVVQEKTRVDETATDQDIEDAIADAFKSAMSSAQVGNHIKSKTEVHHAVKPKSRKKSVRNLTHEIAQQVQDRFKDEHGSSKKISPMALSSYGDSPSYSGPIQHNRTLQAAIKTAVKSAVGTEKEDAIVDIEELQMNEIIENALKMAAENPQDLISGLEIDHIVGVHVEKKTDNEETPRRDTLDQVIERKGKGKIHKPAKDQLRVPPSLEGKSKLNHKSPTPDRNNKQTDISSRLLSREDDTKSSLLSNPDIKSQISSVMSSLTSKINSGELADTNILFTIRQITEELASGGTLTSFLSNQASSTATTPATEKEDRQILANALGMARIFLLEFATKSHVQEKSVSEMNTMISNLNEDFSSPSLELSIERAEFISSIANATLTTLVDNTADIQYSAEVFNEVEEFRNSSPEARRRTRIGNRERKKKWREENAERNRIIEIRTRVLKKALTEFGEEDTPDKLEWIESEIKRRKERRYARVQTDEEKTEGVSKTEKTKSQDVQGKVQHVSQDKRLIHQVKDVVKIFFEKPDNSKSSSDLITVSSVLGALSLIYSETVKFDEEIMLAGMKAILKAITTRVHILDGHKSRLSSEALRTESSKRRLSEILFNAKRLKVDPDIVTSISNKPPQSMSISDGIMSKPSLQLPRDSPFISHKVGGANASASTTGLRKPGSFQKPKPFENPRKDKRSGGSLSSPKLYSTT